MSPRRNPSRPIHKRQRGQAADVTILDEAHNLDLFSRPGIYTAPAGTILDGNGWREVGWLSHDGITFEEEPERGHYSATWQATAAQIQSIRRMYHVQYEAHLITALEAWPLSSTTTPRYKIATPAEETAARAIKDLGPRLPTTPPPATTWTRTHP